MNNEELPYAAIEYKVASKRGPGQYAPYLWSNPANVPPTGVGVGMGWASSGTVDESLYEGRRYEAGVHCFASLAGALKALEVAREIYDGRNPVILRVEARGPIASGVELYVHHFHNYWVDVHVWREVRILEEIPA